MLFEQSTLQPIQPEIRNPQEVVRNNPNDDSPLPFIRFNFRRIYTDTSIENRAKYNNIVANLKKLIQYIILYFVFLLLLCIQCTFTQTWQIQYPLLIPVAYYCFDAYRNISNFKRTYIRGSQYLNTIERNRDRHDNEIELEVLIRCRRKILFKNTFENMMLALTYILIMFSSAQVLPIPLYSCIAPLLITFISKFFCQICVPSSLEMTVQVLSILYSLARIVILAFVFLKIDGVISWTWSAVLWSYWISFVFMAIFSLILLIIFLTSIKAYFEELTKYQAIIGSFWVFMFIGGITMSTFITALSATKMYDNKSIENSRINIFLCFFLPNLLYLSIILCLTFACWWQIISWFDYFLYGEAEEDQDELDIEEGQQVREITIKNIRLKIPIFIKRISNTLFVKSTRKDRKAYQLHIQKTEEHKQTQSEVDSRIEQIDQNQDKSIRSIKTDNVKISKHHKLPSFGGNQEPDPLKSSGNHIKSLAIINKNRNKGHDPNISNQSLASFSQENRPSSLDFGVTRTHNPIQAFVRNTELLNKLSRQPKSRFMKNSKFKPKDVLSVKSINDKCNVCCERLCDAVLMECGHGGVCYECALTSIKFDDRCYFCRNIITSILQVELSQDNMNMLKVILITVIEWENSIDDIDKIVDMLENNESKGPDEYHSDDEDHKQSTAKNNLEVCDLKSDISHPISLSKRKHSLTTFDHQQFVRHNLLLNSNQSRVSSCVRLDPIEKFRQINNSVESSEECKVVTKNVANLNLYIPSNRINTESMNSNRMKHYSFRKSKRLIDSYRSSKSDLQNILVINVNKAEENDYNSNTQQLNSKRQNEDMQKVGLIRIEEEGPQFLNSSAEYIYKLKKQLQEKYKSSNDLNQNGENIMREKNIENMYKHFVSPKNSLFQEAKSSDCSIPIVDHYPESNHLPTPHDNPI